MKDSIHPSYTSAVEVRCSCGHVFRTGSTAEAISIEVCSHCHPFYTGSQKLVDTAGRVDKFRKRLRHINEGAAQKKVAKKQARKAAKASAEE